MFLAVPFAVLSLLLVLRVVYERTIRDRKIPPGPPRFPLIGNLHQAPKPHQLPWHFFASWARQYGPIFSAQFGPNLFIFLASETAAHDLLNKRGARFSDRPRCVMANECQEKGLHIMFRNLDETLKKHQRMEAAVLTPTASAMYAPVQDLETRQLLFDLHTRPNVGFAKHFERFAFSIVHLLTYGIRAALGEPKIGTVLKIEDDVVEAADGSKWIIDLLPVLNHLPKPLAPWKKIADAKYEFQRSFFLENMTTALNGETWSWTKEFAQSPEGRSMSETELSFDLGMLAMAGLATTSNVLQVFVVAAMAYPDVMNAAKKELDDVVGCDRLPTIEDRTQLPLVVAVMKEVFRWHDTLPSAFPHAVRSDEEYMGYRIPAGTTIIGLQWCMNHDESRFPGSDNFDPSRWLKGGSDQLKYQAFGFGRRVCPGRHVAENSVFLAVARLLWAYDITAPAGWKYDEQAWEPKFFTRPVGLTPKFSVRSDAHRDLIERECARTDADAREVLDAIGQQRTIK